MAKIKTSDIYENTGEFQELLDQLTKLEDKIKQVRKANVESANTLEKSTSKLSAATVEYREELVITSKQAVEIERRNIKLEESLTKVAIGIAGLKESQRILNNVNKLEAKILGNKEGSYNRLSAQYSLNKLRLNELSKEQRSNTEEGKELVKSTNEIYQEMKRLQEETGKNVLSVGDYGRALDGLNSPINGAINGIKGIGASLKLLLANPIVLFLAAIVGALSVLFKAFKRSAKGSEILGKATAVISSIMGNLTELSVKLFGSLKETFGGKGIIESIKILGRAFVEGVGNRIVGILNTVTSLGRALRDLVTLDFSSLKQSLKDVGAGIVESFTGLNADKQLEFAKAVKETAEEVESEARALIALENAKASNESRNRSLAKSMQLVTTEREKQQLIADDTTKSFKERAEASDLARIASEKLAKQEISIARNALSLINTELAIRRDNGEETGELLNKQLEARKSIISAERNLILFSLKNESKLRKSKQDKLKTDLGILEEGFDNQKKINLRLLKDDEITFEDRRALLSETVTLSNDSFDKQIESLQSFTDETINSNELINESNSILLNQKIRNLGLSSLLENELLDTIKNRRLAVLELSEAEVILNASEVKSKEEKAKAEVLRLEKLRQSQLEEFDQLQDFNESSFELTKNTEFEKTKFRLEQEQARLAKILEINTTFQGDLAKLQGDDIKINALIDTDLTQTQADTIKNQILAIGNEIDGLAPESGDKDLFDLLGLDLDDDTKEGIKSGFDFIKGQLNELTQARLDAANAAVQAADSEIASAERLLQAEISSRNAGFANNVETQKQELALAKANQKKALAEQEKAKKAQLAIQTIEQGANLITASTKIFAQVGYPFAIPLIAAMFGTFIAAKAKAFKLAKTTFGDGGMEIIGGGSHASGNDTYLGFASGGKPAYAERGEAHFIVPTTQTKKYRSILPQISDSLRNGTFETQFMRLNSGHRTDNNINLQQVSVNTSGMESELSQIRQNGEVNYYTNSEGKLVERYKNRTRTYV